MDGERLEWALRRLPGVLACSLDGDTVTLLLDPHASVPDVEAGANALLLGAGDSRPPVLLGGTRPVVTGGRRRFDVVPVAKAAAPGIVAIGAAALVATLVTSPAAFWRDVVPPPATDASSQPSGPGQPPAPPVTRTVAAMSDPLDNLWPVDRSRPVETAATAAAATPAPANVDRRLVLLVPQLPSAPRSTSDRAEPAAPSRPHPIAPQPTVEPEPTTDPNPVKPASPPPNTLPSDKTSSPAHPTTEPVTSQDKVKHRASKRNGPPAWRTDSSLRPGPPPAWARSRPGAEKGVALAARVRASHGRD